ncbi:MAG: TlpA disulfide reductase family protein [Bacillota bacterium]
MQEVLQLQPHITAWQERGIEVVFATRSAESSILSFIDENDVIMQVLLDGDGQLHSSYGVSGIPAIFVIDAGGIIRHTETGWGSGSVQTLGEWVEELVD